MSQAKRNLQVEPDRWEEALEWHAILEVDGEAELPLDRFREWQKWIADKGNRRVYDQLTYLVGKELKYPAVGRPTAEQLGADDYDGSIPLAQWRANQRRSRPQPAR